MEENDLLNEGHSKGCELWYGGTFCTCWLRFDPDADVPERKPKGHKPKMGRDGDSVKLLEKMLDKRAKNIRNFQKERK